MGKISKMNELINDIIYSVSLVRNDIEFNNIEKSVLGMKNARLSYEFARNFSNANGMPRLMVRLVRGMPNI